MVAQTILPALNLYSHVGAVMIRRRAASPVSVNSSPMATRDGYIMPSYAGFAEWEALAALLGIPELAEERFLTLQGRLRHAAEIDRLVEPVFARMSKHDLFGTGQEWRFTFTAVQTARTWRLSAPGRAWLLRRAATPRRRTHPHARHGPVRERRAAHSRLAGAVARTTQ